MRHEADTNSPIGLQTRACPHRVPTLANHPLCRLTAIMANEFGSGWAISHTFAPNAEVRPLCQRTDEAFLRRSC